MNCYCGSTKDFNICCAPIHEGLVSASCAEVLMRARYSAFVIGNISFLYNSFHPLSRRFQSKQEIKNWATANTWLRLEIISSTRHTVEFKAYYEDPSATLQIHHEKSNFKELQGKWYYADGRLIQ